MERKKYSVDVNYSVILKVEVIASSEEEALELAGAKASTISLNTAEVIDEECVVNSITDLSPKEIVIDYMKEHNLKAIPLYCDDTKVGQITDEFKYERNQFGSTLSDYGLQKIPEFALKSLEIFKSILAKWNTPMKVEVVRYDNYKPESTETWSDTFDKLCEKLESANKTYRYCNGMYYKFKDAQMDKDYRKWIDIIPFERSFNLYYQGSIVD